MSKSERIGPRTEDIEVGGKRGLLDLKQLGLYGQVWGTELERLSHPGPGPRVHPKKGRGRGNQTKR